MKLVITIAAGALAFMFITCGDQASNNNNVPKAAEKIYTAYIRDSSATVDTLDITFYLPVNCYPGITTVRPLKTDTSVAFVCAAAFTLLEDDAIDGLLIDRGAVKVKWVNHSLGGGILIPDSATTEIPQIFGTDMGNKLDSVFRDSVVAMNGSFFQQIQLVRDGQALVFHKEFSRFQRRALCIWHNELVVVESVQPCTMQKFADVLKSCGIKNALYVDMGSWDEGWYRGQNGQEKSIGSMKNETDRQSNWFVLKARK